MSLNIQKDFQSLRDVEFDRGSYGEVLQLYTLRGEQGSFFSVLTPVKVLSVMTHTPRGHSVEGKCKSGVASGKGVTSSLEWKVPLQVYTVGLSDRDSVPFSSVCTRDTL